MLATTTFSRRLITKQHQLCRSPMVVKRTSTNTTSTEVVKEAAMKADIGKSFAERNPFLFQLGVATAKTSAADVMVQVVVEKKKIDELDLKRNAIFVVFGFAYLGGFQYWLMVTKFSKWFPTRDRFSKLSLGEKLKDTAGMIDALKMVAFDVCVHLPLIYFPAYYTCKEIVTGTSWNPIDWVKDGCTKYWGNKEEDLTAMIKLWGPSDCIQFSMPIHISMPFRHMVSFFWTAYVSFTRGSVSDDEEGIRTLKRRLSVSGDSA
ncbi:hypothetical protein ACHAXS_011795 [Conticribra weissflogii]